jgi:hypothetical protein
MQRETNETYIEYLQRLISYCERANGIADHLESLEVMLDFYDLIDRQLGIIGPEELVYFLESERSDVHSMMYNDFIDKHALPWNKHGREGFESVY